MSKGSARRPSVCPPEEVARRWDYAFRPQGEAHLTWEEWLKVKGVYCVKVDERGHEVEMGDNE